MVIGRILLAHTLQYNANEDKYENILKASCSNLICWLLILYAYDIYLWIDRNAFQKRLTLDVLNTMWLSFRKREIYLKSYGTGTPNILFLFLFLTRTIYFLVNPLQRTGIMLVHLKE